MFDHCAQDTVHCVSMCVCVCLKVEWGILNLAGAKVQHTEANKTNAVSRVSLTSSHLNSAEFCLDI